MRASGGEDLDVWFTSGDGARPSFLLPSVPPTGLNFFLSGEEISNCALARDCDAAEPPLGDARCRLLLRLRSGVQPGSSISASSMSSHSSRFSSSMSPRSSSSALRSIKSDSNSSSMPFHSSTVVTQPGDERDMVSRRRHFLRALRVRARLGRGRKVTNSFAATRGNYEVRRSKMVHHTHRQNKWMLKSEKWRNVWLREAGTLRRTCSARRK